MNSRQIKFRVWNNFHKKWIKDAFIDNGGKIWATAFSFHMDGKKIIELAPQNHIVQRCTNVIDKDGELIYEGDVLRNKFNRTGPIIFDGVWHRWQSNSPVFGNCSALTKFNVENGGLYIIGNIFEGWYLTEKEMEEFNKPPQRPPGMEGILIKNNGEY